VLRGVVVSGNIINECNQDNRGGTGSTRFAAIHARALCRYLTITGNHCTVQYGDGISVGHIGEPVTAATAVQITNNVCVYEDPGNGADGTVVGIRIEGTDEVVVLGNIVSRAEPGLEGGGRFIPIVGQSRLPQPLAVWNLLQ
jgi:hypothetical protein